MNIVPDTHLVKAYLAYDEERDRFVCSKEIDAIPYALPEGSDLDEGYEAKKIKGQAVYPIYKGKRLQRFGER